jgi:hypothetical protein
MFFLVLTLECVVNMYVFLKFFSYVKCYISFTLLSAKCLRCIIFVAAMLDLSLVMLYDVTKLNERMHFIL